MAEGPFVALRIDVGGPLQCDAIQTRADNVSISEAYTQSLLTDEAVRKNNEVIHRPMGAPRGKTP